MATAETVRQITLSFPETTEGTHFEKISFKVNKRLLATLDAKTNLLCVKLTPAEQDLFGVFDRTIIYPVPNKWGQQGWTIITLDTVPQEMLLDAIKLAYCTVAPKKLAELVKAKDGSS